MLYADVESHIKTIIDEKIPIVFTSAGNPKTYTPFFRQHNVTVVHVVSSSVFAQKAEVAGCHAVVAEGFEAGGHNGREETTTMVLIPQVCDAVNIPVIAAGGIANGKQMAACFALGASAVQVGSRFLCTPEASCHKAFKEMITTSKEGDTMLSMKKTVPVRLLKNDFYNTIQQAENNGANADELQQILGRGRAKKGMFEGDLQSGELEVGQVSSMIKNIIPAANVVNEIWNEFNATCTSLH